MSCVAQEGRGGVKCRKQSDNPLEGYGHRWEGCGTQEG